jgi:hypothetical protein
MLRQNENEQATSGTDTTQSRKWSWFRKPQRARTDSESLALGETEGGELDRRVGALRAAAKRRGAAVRLACAGGGTVAAGIAAMTAALTTTFGGGTIGSPAYITSLALVFGGEALLLASILRGETALRRAVGDVASTDDLRAVGALAEALEFGEPSRSLAVSALSRLLPQIRPADGDLLTAAQRACLVSALAKSSRARLFQPADPHFASVLRQALAVLGETPPARLADDADATLAPARDVDALLVKLHAAVKRRRSNALTIGASSVVAAGSAVTNMFGPILTHHASTYPLLYLSCGSVAVAITLTLSGTLRLRAMMGELAAAADLRTAGPLLEVAEMPDSGASVVAALLLTALLPRLRSSDTGLLTDRQRAAIGHAILTNPGNPDFIVAALKALEQVGDERALPVVEGLAAGRIAAADPARVRVAAQECLPYLRTRSEEVRANQTLLRASALSDAPSDGLLRPADAAPTGGDAALLRPADAEAEFERRQTSAGPDALQQFAPTRAAGLA